MLRPQLSQLPHHLGAERLSDTRSKREGFAPKILTSFSSITSSGPLSRVHVIDELAIDPSDLANSLRLMPKCSRNALTRR